LSYIQAHTVIYKKETYLCEKQTIKQKQPKQVMDEPSNIAYYYMTIAEQ